MADIPGAPQGLRVLQIDLLEPSIYLAWGLPVNVADGTTTMLGYRLYRDGVLIHDIPLTWGGVSVYDRNVVLNTAYLYEATAYNESGEGPPTQLEVWFGEGEAPEFPTLMVLAGIAAAIGVVMLLGIVVKNLKGRKS